jgi:hypothetical protein
MTIQAMQQKLTVNDGLGEFQPTLSFQKLDIVDQIDLLNDWKYDLDQYRNHLITAVFLGLAKSDGDERSWEQKLNAFCEVSAEMGWILPSDFESFAKAHWDCTSLPTKSCSCPVCNPRN